MIITVAIVTAVVVYCKRQSNYRYNHTHHHPVRVQSVVLLKCSSCYICDLVYIDVESPLLFCQYPLIMKCPSYY